MLAKSDLSQIQKIIRTETTNIVHSELIPVKKDINSLKTDVRSLKVDVRKIIKKLLLK